ncbi:uncharacterized protein [Leptinotarsa decemlineata]|uniref:uncharacterized protein n=1 Tax=Leptinotarsa decemlineata TaxID=7539 RepID=UPI003D3062BD
MSRATSSVYVYYLVPSVSDLDQIQNGGVTIIYTVIGEPTDSMEVEASADDVAGYLRGWGLANYIETIRIADFNDIYPDHSEALTRSFPLTKERLLNTIKTRIDSSSVTYMKTNLKELLKLAEGIFYLL